VKSGLDKPLGEELRLLDNPCEQTDRQTHFIIKTADSSEGGNE